MNEISRRLVLRQQNRSFKPRNREHRALNKDDSVSSSHHANLPSLNPSVNSSSHNLLVVDDDETIQRLLTMAAADHGWKPLSASSGHEAVELIDPFIQAVVLDLGLPGMNGIETIGEAARKHPGVPVIMLTGTNDAEIAVQALKAGATDYLTKPFEIQRLFDLLRSAVQSVRNRGHRYRRERHRKHRWKPPAPMMRALYRQMEKAANLDSTILLTGESGTGKTYIARQIHLLSKRARKGLHHCELSRFAPRASGN